MPANSPDLLDVVLVTGAFIAPMDLSIFKSFTVYDLSIALLAFLVVAGPLRLRPAARVSCCGFSLCGNGSAQHPSRARSQLRP